MCSQLTDHPACGLTRLTMQVRSTKDCLALLQRGDQNRIFASTEMNAHSSRSHAIVIVTVIKRRKRAMTRSENGEQVTGQCVSIVLSGSFALQLHREREGVQLPNLVASFIICRLMLRHSTGPHQFTARLECFDRLAAAIPHCHAMHGARAACLWCSQR